MQVFEPDPNCVVCTCKSVSEAEIVRLIRAGVDSVEGISARSLAGTGCRGCVEALRELMEDYSDAGQGGGSGC